MSSEDRLEQLVGKFRERGYRLTPQRMALLRLILAGEGQGHPTAAQLYEQIQKQFPTTSLATVYKTLTVLKEMGEIIEIGACSEDRHYDSVKPFSHPHLICIQCCRTVDAEIGPSEAQAQAEAAKALAERTGYRLVGHRFNIYGVCPACQQRARRSRVIL